MTSRSDQIASVIQRALQELLARGLSDPRVQGLISITHVDVTPDLSEAHVWCSIIPAEHAELTMHGLRNAEGHLRHKVGDRIDLRRTPRLSFRLDKSIKREADVLSAINRAQERERPVSSDTDDPERPEESTK